MLWSDLCNYRDECLVVTGNITVANENNNDNYNRKLAFKYNAPFTACILKINGILIDNTEDFYVVMPMYNFLEYNKHYKRQQEVCRIIIKMKQKMVQ